MKTAKNCLEFSSLKMCLESLTAAPGPRHKCTTHIRQWKHFLHWYKLSKLLKLPSVFNLANVRCRSFLPPKSDENVQHGFRCPPLIVRPLFLLSLLKPGHNRTPTCGTFEAPPRGTHQFKSIVLRGREIAEVQLKLRCFFVGSLVLSLKGCNNHAGWWVGPLTDIGPRSLLELSRDRIREYEIRLPARDCRPHCGRDGKLFCDIEFTSRIGKSARGRRTSRSCCWAFVIMRRVDKCRLCDS